MTDLKLRDAPASEELRLFTNIDVNLASIRMIRAIRPKPAKPTGKRIPKSIDAAPVDDRISVDIKTMARISGLSRSTIYRLIDAGELTRIKVGGRTLLMVAELRQLLHAKGGPICTGLLPEPGSVARITP